MVRRDRGHPTRIRIGRRWRGPGEGPGNARLKKRGAVPVRSLDELEAAVLEPAERAGAETFQAKRVSSISQPTLFADPSSGG